MVEAFIAHRGPRRVRLSVPDKRGDSAFFQAMVDTLQGYGDVRNIRANPITGSVIVEGEDKAMAKLLRGLVDSDFLSIAEAGAGRRGVGAASHRHPDATGADASAALRRSDGSQPAPTRGRETNHMFMVGTALVAAGILQALRGDWLPPAVTMLWYAGEAFRLAARPH